MPYLFTCSRTAYLGYVGFCSVNLMKLMTSMCTPHPHVCLDAWMNACMLVILQILLTLFSVVFFLFIHLLTLVIYGTVNLLQYWVTSRFFYRVSQSWNQISHAILGVYGALWLYICSVSTFLWVLEDCLLLPNSCINLFLIGKIRWVNYLYIFVILINHSIYISNYQK